jgi:RibD C-terminal domain
MVDDAKRDVSIGGPTLAAHARRAGILDEVRVFMRPVVVGGGTSRTEKYQGVDDFGGWARGWTRPATTSDRVDDGVGLTRRTAIQGS